MFEYDVRKSAKNKQKHGIDFEEAKRLWDDPYLLSLKVATIDEPRFIVIGMIDGKHWTAVVTLRKEKIRLISVRRSRKKEADVYEKNQGY